MADKDKKKKEDEQSSSSKKYTAKDVRKIAAEEELKNVNHFINVGNNALSEASSSWKTQDEMNAYKYTLNKSNDVVSKFAGKYGDLYSDINSVAKQYNDALNGWDDLSAHYGYYQNADAYNQALEDAKKHRALFDENGKYSFPTTEKYDQYRELINSDDFEDLVEKGKEISKRYNGMFDFEGDYGFKFDDTKDIRANDYAMSRDIAYYILAKSNPNALETKSPEIKTTSLDVTKPKMSGTYDFSPNALMPNLKSKDESLDYFDKNFEHKDSYLTPKDEDTSDKLPGELLKQENLNTSDAYDFLDESKFVYDKWAYDLAADKLRDKVADNRLLQYGSMALSPFTGLADAVALPGILKDKANPYTGMAGSLNLLNEAVGTAHEKLNERHPDFSFLGRNASEWASIFESTAKSAANMHMFGWASSPIMSIDAYNSEYLEGLQRGLDKENARNTAIVAGINEALFEAVSIGGFKIFQGKNATGFKDILKNILKQSVTEGSEEVATEIANTLADNYFNKEQSKYNQNKAEYVKRGFSEEEASNMAYKDFWSQVADAGIAGAISGGIMTGVSSTANYANNVNTGKGMDVNLYRDTLNQMQAMNPEATKGAVKNYTDLQNKLGNDLNAKTWNDYASMAVNANEAYAENLKAMNEAEYQMGIGNEQGIGDYINAYNNAANLKASLENDGSNRLVTSSKEDGKLSAKATEIANAIQKADANVDLEGNSIDITNVVTDGEGIKLETSNGEIKLSDAKLTEDTAQMVAYATDIKDEAKRTAYVEGYNGQNASEYTKEFNRAWNMGAEGKAKAVTGGNTIDSKTAKRIALSSLETASKADRATAKVGEQISSQAQKAGIKAGNFDTSSVDMSKLTRTQRKYAQFLKVWSDVTGMNIKVTNELSTKNSDNVDNGSYDEKTNTVTINLSAKYTKSEIFNGKYVMSTISHEFTHWIKGQMGAEFDILVNAVKESMTEKQFQDLIDAELERDSSLTEETAEEEVIARACEDMLNDSKVARDILSNVDAKGLEKLKNAVIKFFDRIGQFFDDMLNNYSSNADAAKAVAESKEAYAKIKEAWINLMNEAIARNQQMEIQEETKAEVEEEAKVEVKEETKVESKEETKDETKEETEAETQEEVEAEETVEETKEEVKAEETAVEETKEEAEAEEAKAEETKEETKASEDGYVTIDGDKAKVFDHQPSAMELNAIKPKKGSPSQTIATYTDESGQQWDYFYTESINKVAKLKHYELSESQYNEGKALFEAIYGVKFSKQMDTDAEIIESMTMADCKEMIQRAFNLGEIKEWFDGKYKNGDEWIKGEGAEAVALIVDNEYVLQTKYINKIQGIIDGNFVIEDVLDAYLKGTLLGKEKVKAKRLDISRANTLAKNEFYSPRNVKNYKEAYTIACEKLTSKNKEEVMKARADVVIFAHNNGAADLLGISNTELNKKLRQWTNYSARAREASERINRRAPLENRWSGIENCAWINKAVVTNEQLDALVGEVKGDSNGSQRAYIIRTMLALDTHIDYKGLKFEFKTRPKDNEPHTNGYYSDHERSIVVKYNAPNTVAHEMGHYVDYQWGRDLGFSQPLTEACRDFNSKKNLMPETKQWLANFENFLTNIESSGNMSNAYSQDSKEVFARFVDKFVRWTDTLAGGHNFSSSLEYNDKFTNAQYVEFAVLLQERASLPLEQALEDSLGNKEEFAKELRAKGWSEENIQRTLERLYPSEQNKVHKSNQLTYDERYLPGEDFSMSLSNSDYIRIDQMIKENEGIEILSGEKMLLLGNKTIYNKDGKITRVITTESQQDLDNNENTVATVMHGAILKYENTLSARGTSFLEYLGNLKYISNKTYGEINFRVDFGHYSFTDAKNGYGRTRSLLKKTSGVHNIIDIGNENITRNGESQKLSRKKGNRKKFDSNDNKLNKYQIQKFEHSKVRDNEGRLLVVYHGSKGDAFVEFDEENGIWVTPNRRYALEYSGGLYDVNDKLSNEVYDKKDGYRVYELYANITNPLDIGQINGSLNHEAVYELAQKIGIIKAKNMTDFEKLFDIAYDIGGKRFENERKLYELTKDKRFIEIVKKYGFDGMEAVEGVNKTWCAFKSRQVKLTDNKNASTASDIRLSKQLETPLDEILGENKALTRNNEKLKEDVKKLRKRLSIEKQVTNGKYLNEHQLEVAARVLLKDADSTYTKAELTDDLREIYSYVMNNPDATENDVMNRCIDAARRVVEKGRPHKVEVPYVSEALVSLRSARIKLTEEQMQEARNAYGDDWRKAFWGRVTIANDGVSLDTLWNEWAEQYPGLGFDADLNPNDQVTRLSEMYDNLKDAQYMVEERNVRDETLDQALEIYNKLWNIEPIQTVSDKYKREINVLKYEHKKAMKEMKEDFKAEKKDAVANQKLVDDMYYGRKLSQAERRRIEQLKSAAQHTKDKVAEQRHQDVLYYGNLMQKLRERKAEQIASLKEYQRNKEANMRDARERRKVLSKIIDTSKDLFKMMNENSAKKHVPVPFQIPLKNLLEAIDYSSKQKLGMINSAKSGMPTKQDVSFVQAMEKVRDAVAQIENESMELPAQIDFPPEFADSWKNLCDRVIKIERSIRSDNVYIINEMSTEELTELSGLLKSMKQAINNTNKMLASANAHSVDTYANNTAKRCDSIKKRKVLSKGEGIMKFFRYDNATPYYVFKQLGEDAQFVFNQIVEGWNNYAFHIQEIETYIDNFFNENKIDRSKIKEWQEHTNDFEVSLRDEEGQPTKEKQKITMTDAQIMSLYCLSKRDQAMSHINGEGIRITDINSKGEVIVQAKKVPLLQSELAEIISVVENNAEMKKTADALQKFMNTTCKDWGNEITMKRFLMNGFTEENYFPIVVDTNALRPTDRDKVKSIYALLNMGFTKPLAKNAKNPIQVTDIFEVFNQHSEEMAKYNALALPVLDMIHWWGYSSDDVNLRSSIEEAFGKDCNGYINHFLADLNSQKERGRGDNIAKSFIKKYKVTAVAANIKVALLQPVSYVRARLVIDGKYLRKGVAGKNKQAREEMLKYSGLALWKNMGFYDVNLGKGLDDIIWKNETKLQKAVNKSMMPAEIGDSVTWGALWNACKYETMDKTNLEGKELLEKTAERFNQVVLATQVFDSTLSRSDLMRSQSAWAQTLTAFMSEPTLGYNTLLDAYNTFKDSYRQSGNFKDTFKKHGKLIGKTAVMYALSAATEALVRASWDAAGGDDDDDESFLEKFLAEFKSNALVFNNIPLFRDIIAYADNLLDGNNTWNDPKRTEYEVINNLFKAWGYLGEATDGLSYKQIYTIVQSLSQASGIPMSGALKSIKEIWNVTIANMYPDLRFEDIVTTE